MLVLSRKPNESVRVDGNVIVKVLHVQGKNVRLGIDAPFAVPVERLEVRDKMKMQIDAIPISVG